MISTKFYTSHSIKLLVTALLVTLLSACDGGGSGDSSPGDGTGSSDKVSIRGTVSTQMMTAFESQSGVSSQNADNTIDSSDLRGKIMVIATSADGNSYSAMTDDSGRFSLEVPPGKSYVIMFVNSAGKFIGLFVHNSNVDTGSAVYRIEGNTELGEVAFTSGGRAIPRDRSRGQEMKNKMDQGAEERDYPDTPDDIATRGGDRINILSMLALPDGSYSYIVEPYEDDDGEQGFYHYFEYNARVELHNEMYLAKVEISLCETTLRNEGCTGSSTDGSGSIKMYLYQVSMKGLEVKYVLAGDTLVEAPGGFAIPAELKVNEPYEFSYRTDDGQQAYSFSVSVEDAEKDASFNGRRHTYIVLKVTETETVNGEQSEPETVYSWGLKGYGFVTDSDRADISDLTAISTTRYIYNARKDRSYGTEPGWLSRNKAALLAAARTRIGEIMDAIAAYRPDGQQTFSIDSTEYQVWDTEYDWENSCRSVGSDEISIGFYSSPHSDTKGWFTIDFTYSSNAALKRDLMAAGSSGLDVSVDSICLDHTGGNPSCYGNDIDEPHDVKLTWKSNNNTFDLSPLNVTVNDSETGNSYSLSTQTLTAQWRSTANLVDCAAPAPDHSGGSGDDDSDSSGGHPEGSGDDDSDSSGGHTEGSGDGDSDSSGGHTEGSGDGDSDSSGGHTEGSGDGVDSGDSGGSHTDGTDNGGSQ